MEQQEFNYNNLENVDNILKVSNKEFKVQTVYPFVYDYGNGKEVLRIEVSEQDHSFDELLFLKTNNNDIYHYSRNKETQEEKKLAVYSGYYKDFICNYRDGKYSIEIYRISDTDLQVQLLNEQLNPSIDVGACTLDELKEFNIKKSRENLDKYLNDNYLVSKCHGGVEKHYTITKEKQQLLTQMISIVQLSIANGIPYTASWNAKDEPCTYDWTIEELQQLALEMEQMVRPLISKQQQMEYDIRNAETKEDVLRISIDF